MTVGEHIRKIEEQDAKERQLIKHIKSLPDMPTVEQLHELDRLIRLVRDGGKRD